MTTPILRPGGVLTIAGDTLPASRGFASLDAMNVPYGTARITVPLTTAVDPEDIDPRDGIRATLAGGDDFAGTSRTFDLGVRSRSIDHKGKTIEVELATDEALLQDYAPITTDTGARAHEASLRAVVDYVLDKIGASLEAGTHDADVTAAWSVTNLLSNPSFETNTNGWVAAGPTSGIARSTTGIPPTGAANVNVTSAGAGNSYVGRAEPVRVNGGTLYTFSAYLRPNAADRQGRVFMRWLDESGATIRENFAFESSLSTTVWTRISVTALAPPTAASVQVFAGMAASASGQVCRVDACMLNEGGLTTYIDGDLADSDYYSYAWDDGTDSTSTRTPFVERDPDLFTWDPGVSAWDFLDPFTASTGLRLFCDEQRQWWLIDPADHYVPGVLTLSPQRSTEGTDTISLGDPEVYCTGVVILYSWTDRANITRTRRDAAGSPGLVLVVEINRPWPGSGVAAAMLARRNGQGRVQAVTALARWTAVPGMQVIVSLPGTVDQIGQLEAVTWNLVDGLMEVKTRALTDIIPGSIDALLGTIDDLVGTIDSL